jgi:hypothetical protein
LEVPVQLLPLFTVATVIAVALALPAFGGKPNAPTLEVSMTSASGPSATSVSSFSLHGCGYSKLTTLIVWHDSTGPWTEVTPDANGCVTASFSPFGIDPTGSYVGQSWQMQGNHWDKSAEVSFSVS